MVFSKFRGNSPSKENEDGNMSRSNSGIFYANKTSSGSTDLSRTDSALTAQRRPSDTRSNLFITESPLQNMSGDKDKALRRRSLNATMDDALLMRNSPSLGSVPGEPALGEGSLRLDHLLLPDGSPSLQPHVVHDTSLSSPNIPELTVQAASPPDVNGTQGTPSIGSVLMQRRGSDRSDVSDADARTRARSATLGATLSESSRRRSSSAAMRGRPRGGSSATNSPVPSPVKQSSGSRSGGIASAIAMSGVALGAQGSAGGHSAVFQPSTFAPPSPLPLVGRTSRGASFGEDDEYALARGQSLDSAGTTDFASSFGFDDLVGAGYAVASSRRNQEFHAMFEAVGEDDYLIEDYGCAIQKEILVQGRLYISEHHLCFNANIFGWVTHLVIPFSEVVAIEKRFTAFVIPNAIQVATMNARHTFASFLSRDTTYELLINIWRISHPTVPPGATLPMDDQASEEDSGNDEVLSNPEEPPSSTRKRRGLRKKRAKKSSKLSSSATSVPNGHSATGSVHDSPVSGSRKREAHRVTAIPASVEKFSNVCLDETFPSSPEKIYNLMFTSQGFMREFWAVNQKLTDITVHDWAPAGPAQLLTREYSYVKPLTAPVGPKSTKCYITDQTEKVDFDDYVVVLTITKTPDVPSGNSFSIRTRTCITWAKNNCCRVHVSTGVDWTKSSFLKGVITSSATEGQKSFHADLAKEMKAYISKHKSEFQHDGAGDEIEDEVVETADAALSQDENAADAVAVVQDPLLQRIVVQATALTEPFIELFQSTFDSILNLCSGNRIVTLVVVLLVVSNLWTLGSLRSTTPPRLPVDSHRNPGEVADAVKGVLREYFAAPVSSPPDGTLSLTEECADIERTLDALQKRIEVLRKTCSPVHAEL